MQETVVTVTALDSTAIISISAAVVALTQLIKWVGLPDRLGPISVLALSAVGIGVWGFSKGTFVSTSLFDYFAGWIAVATSAAGVFGFTRASAEAVTKTSPPPSGGAGSNTTLSLLLVCVLGASLIACGPKLPPNTSLEAQLAVRGDQVVQAMRQVLPNLKPHVCLTPAQTTCVKPDDAGRIAKLMETGFVTAEALGKSLQAVDIAQTASEREQGIVRAREFIRSLHDTLSQAQIVPGDEQARAIVVKVMAVVVGTLFAIGGF